MILRFKLLPKRYAVARLASDQAIPQWALRGTFAFISRTPDELSIICEEEQLPAELPAARGWRCFGAVGPFAFTDVGVAAEFTTVLAKSNVSVLVISTYETDYLLVPAEKVERATAALLAAGHSFTS